MNSQPATSGSASCQTHLSTTNSQQRLRATNSYAAQPTKQSAALSTTVLSNPNTLATALRTFFPLDQLQDHHPLPRSWKGLASRWIALVYCFLSLIFLSIALYKHICLGNTFRNPVHNIPGIAFCRISPVFKFSTLTVTSTLEFLSAEQRLSRPYPGLKMFDPYLLPGARSTNDRAITACLWTTDAEDNFPAIVAWASGWKGAQHVDCSSTSQRNRSHLPRYGYNPGPALGAASATHLTSPKSANATFFVRSFLASRAHHERTISFPRCVPQSCTPLRGFSYGHAIPCEPFECSTVKFLRSLGFAPPNSETRASHQRNEHLRVFHPSVNPRRPSSSLPIMVQ